MADVTLKPHYEDLPSRAAAVVDPVMRRTKVGVTLRSSLAIMPNHLDWAIALFLQ